MKLGFYKFFILFFFSVFSFSSFAENVETAPPTIIPSLNALQAEWVFSGIVTNENGESYSYYFQMKRVNEKLSAIATLIDVQTKEALLFEQAEATLTDSSPTNWQAGNSFMQFNPINNSWLFGVKLNKKGFNFKVDLLSQVNNLHRSEDLRSGVEFLVNQTGRLNGHIQINEKESHDQFVTAPKAWFKQVWLTDAKSEKAHPVTGILCQFNDGSGFYSVNLQEEDARQGAVAGWRNEQGDSIPMSQFVSVKEGENNQWRINVPSPKLELSLKNVLEKENGTTKVIAGLIEGSKPGFCAISEDVYS